MLQNKFGHFHLVWLINYVIKVQVKQNKILRKINEVITEFSSNSKSMKTELLMQANTLYLLYKITIIFKHQNVYYILFYEVMNYFLCPG